MDEDRQGKRSTRRGNPSRRERAPKARTPKRKARTPAPAAQSSIGAADPRRSRSLEYGIAILECYSGERQALGISDLAETVGISRSTTHRYAMTLLALGYLEQDAKRKYLLSPGAADPGRVAIETLRGQVQARAVLEELRAEVGYTVSMGVLCGARVIYLYRLFGHRAGQYAIDRGVAAGASVPVHCTALGKALLAGLGADERATLLEGLKLTPQGPKAIVEREALQAAIERIGGGGGDDDSAERMAIDDEEHVEGGRSLAVLVPRSRGGYRLAIAVSVPAGAYSAARLRRELGPPLRRAAKLISGG